METIMSQRILIWDIPTRIFHWALALSFAGAFVIAETERYRDLHVALGYLVLGLIGFRLLWGFAGSRYARFSSFIYSPGEIVAYVKSLLRRNPRHYLGHNPAGAVAIFLLLGLGVVTGISGALLYAEVGGEMFEDLHEGAANLMLAVVLVHIAGVFVSSLLHRENLVRAMVTGYKHGEPAQGISRPFAWLGVIMVGIIAAFLTFYHPSGNTTSGDGGTRAMQHTD
jgi:cytochrome b